MKCGGETETGEGEEGSSLAIQALLPVKKIFKSSLFFCDSFPSKHSVPIEVLRRECN